MAKIYLAKSNKSNPNHVMHVRQSLMNQGHEVVEFLGGQYSDAPMLECNAVVAVVTEYDHSSETQVVGRGLYDQGSVCIYGANPVPFYVFVPKPDPNKTQAFIGLDIKMATELKRKDGDSWIEYGTIKLSEAITDFSAIFPSVNPNQQNENPQSAGDIRSIL